MTKDNQHRTKDKERQESYCWITKKKDMSKGHTTKEKGQRLQGFIFIACEGEG
jgi:hypothetical protein